MKTENKTEPKQHQGRGQLTDKVQVVARKFFGRDITVCELRLIPYVQYRLCNERRLDRAHLNHEELGVLAQWASRGWIDLTAEKLTVTKEFWDAMHEILWVAYANHD